jgi:hypothetical protein
VVELKPVDGLHEYVVAPDAVNVVELPAQIVALPTVNVTVGIVLNVITTSSVDGVQGLFEIVHLNVYVEPAKPLKVEVALDGVVIVPPVPLTMLQAPVPTEGVLPARVTVVNPHVDEPVWSVPAAAVVGAAFTVTVPTPVTPASI